MTSGRMERKYFEGDFPSEKRPAINATTNGDPEAIGEQDGYVLDTTQMGNGELRTAKDGHTILIPQPSISPADPLNWSDFKKEVILIVVSATAFLPDYGSATGAVTLIPQAG